MNLTELLRLLGDTTRLRILRLLAREKLNVSELTLILGQAQSGISRHLRLLKEAGFLAEHRESGWAYYGVEPKQFTDDGIQRLWPVLLKETAGVEHAREDEAGLKEVLRQRKEDFRENQGGATRTAPPGRSWAAWARTLGFLAPRCAVADLGCGEGYLTLEVARWARRVYAVDQSPEMLAKARRLAERHSVRNITWKRADVKRLPLPTACVDVVLMSQLLHCVEKPVEALAEAHRILTPGGALLLQELRTHEEEWVRERFGDIWLGFEEKQLLGFLKETKFEKARIETGARRHGDPFVVLVGFGRKLE